MNAHRTMTSCASSRSDNLESGPFRYVRKKPNRARFLVAGCGLSAIAMAVAGCSSDIHKTVAVACQQHIGRPISEHIAAYGPPKFTYRISETLTGYAFETKDREYIGNNRYYEVNYLTGVTNHRTPTRLSTITCRGNFVVKDNGLPGSQKIIVDIVPGF